MKKCSFKLWLQILAAIGAFALAVGAFIPLFMLLFQNAWETPERAIYLFYLLIFTTASGLLLQFLLCRRKRCVLFNELEVIFVQSPSKQRRMSWDDIRPPQMQLAWVSVLAKQGEHLSIVFGDNKTLQLSFAFAGYRNFRAMLQKKGVLKRYGMGLPADMALDDEEVREKMLHQFEGFIPKASARAERATKRRPFWYINHMSWYIAKPKVTSTKMQLISRLCALACVATLLIAGLEFTVWKGEPQQFRPAGPDDMFMYLDVYYAEPVGSSLTTKLYFTKNEAAWGVFELSSADAKRYADTFKTNSRRAFENDPTLLQGPPILRVSGYTVPFRRQTIETAYRYGNHSKEEFYQQYGRYYLSNSQFSNRGFGIVLLAVVFSVGALVFYQLARASRPPTFKVFF